MSVWSLIYVLMVQLPMKATIVDFYLILNFNGYQHAPLIFSFQFHKAYYNKATYIFTTLVPTVQE